MAIEYQKTMASATGASTKHSGPSSNAAKTKKADDRMTKPLASAPGSKVGGEGVR